MIIFRRAALWLGIVFFTLPVYAQPSASLTLEQRVAQMFMATVHGAQLPETGRDFLQQWQPGAVVLFTSNIGDPQAITRLTNSYQQAMLDAGGVPLLIATDQEGGVVQRLTAGFTQWPVPVLVTATNNPELQQAFGEAIAEELRAVGINMNLAPVADLETRPDNPIIKRRGYGSDPQIAGNAIYNVVSGFQNGQVLATLKHFPGHGETDRDSHVEMPVITLDRDRLLSTEIGAFRLALNAEAVMAAHIWYPALEPEENLPASLSPNVITGILRDQLGYDGIIMTDAIDMDAIDRQFSYPGAAVMAVQAGVDMIAMGPGMGMDTQAAMMQAVIDAVRSGEISEERINESVDRILDAKARYGVLDWQPLDPTTAEARMNIEAHATLVDTLFHAGATIVYDHNSLLPIAPEDDVAIVYLATRNLTIPECNQYHPNIRWSSAARFPSDDDIARAVDAASRSDKVVVFTQNATDNPAQQALVHALPPQKTIVIATESLYDWLAFPDVSAYMLTYSPLFQAIPAACAALFGAQPTSGILPVTLSPQLLAGTHASLVSSPVSG